MKDLGPVAEKKILSKGETIKYGPCVNTLLIGTSHDRTRKRNSDYHLLSDELEAIAEVCPCLCKRLTKSQSNP
jgi:hypothetical protein